MEPITSLPVASTIDAVNDTFPIVTNSINTTQQISRNTFLGLASAPVGLTDSQTLTNKVLTSPTVSGPTFSGTLIGTYTIGGTPTFPASVATLTGSQTLTNKVLTSPTINSPSITNATITADTYAGYTTSNSGTIYGIAVTTGQITGAATIASGALASASVFPSNLISGLSSSTWAWVDYSSSITFTNFTKGNATIVARYAQIGKTVHYRGEVTLGSSSSMGTSPLISLPITSSSTGYSAASTNGINDILGMGSSTRQGTGTYLLCYAWQSTTTAVMLTYNAAGTYLVNASVSATVPNTWASTDTFTWDITYEAA